MAGARVSFVPPPYPYDRLDGLKKLAERHDGGPVDCSIGTPVDAPAGLRHRRTRQGHRRRGYPASIGSPAYREAGAAWLERRFAVTVGIDQLAACVGTKEFVASLAQYLHLRSPDATRSSIPG